MVYSAALWAALTFWEAHEITSKILDGLSGADEKAEPIACADVGHAELAPQRPEGRPVDKGVASRVSLLSFFA